MTDEAAAEADEAPPQPDENAPATFPPDDESPPVSDGGARGALWDLVSRHPFRALHDRWADIPTFNFRQRCCFLMEFTITTLVVSIVVTIACLLAWKAIMPLPKF